MKTIVFYIVAILCFSHCKVQEKITFIYVDYQYEETKNKSFINKRLVLATGKDSLEMNIKLPYDRIHHNVIDRGLLYNCHLKKGTKYTFTLQKKCVTDIPETFNSYYRLNTIPDKDDCSKFIEIKKDTEYNYLGDYGKYVDINSCLYEIIKIYPDDCCFYPHYKTR